MRRRALIAGSLAGAAAAASRARAADPALVAIVSNAAPATSERQLAALRDGLFGVGQVEGRDVTLAIHYLDGEFARLPALADAVVASQPRVIVSSSAITVVALRRATATIPIVMANAADPVGAGLAASLARPGGNVTGLSNQSTELVEKQFELVRELMPAARRVLGVRGVSSILMEQMVDTLDSVARRLGTEARSVRLDERPDLASLREAIVDFRPDALFVLSDPVAYARLREIAALADAARLPVVAPFRELVELGALASYGVSLTGSWGRAAWFVDRILRGANPAEMPIEQPTGFELVINQRAARALGVTVPPVLLTRADEVIE